MEQWKDFLILYLNKEIFQSVKMCMYPKDTYIIFLGNMFQKLEKDWQRHPLYIYVWYMHQRRLILDKLCYTFCQLKKSER